MTNLLLLLTITLLTNGLRYSWPGCAGNFYRLESAPSLSGPWLSVRSQEPSTNGPISFTLPAHGAVRFHRVQAMKVL